MSSFLIALAPGAWYLLVAGLATAALHRAYDPLPRPVALGAVALPAVLLAPVLFAGRVLLPLGVFRHLAPFGPVTENLPRGNLLQSDLVLETLPWLHAVRDAVADGRWPLLDPFTAAGAPLLANTQSQALQPLVWLAAPLPLVDAVGVIAALRIFCALLFTYLLLARLGLARPAAAFGAVSFGLGGFVMLWLGWPLASSAAWLPAVLYATARVVQVGRRRDAALLAFTLFALLAGGHPETVLHAGLLAAAFVVVLAWRLPRPRRRRALATWAAAGLVAAALTAPVLVPAGLYLPRTFRAAATDEIRQTVLSQGWLHGWTTEDPGLLRRSRQRLAEGLAAQVGPSSLGNNRFRHWWGPVNVNAMASGFAGSLALAGALASLGWGLRRRPGEGLMAVTAPVSAALALQVPGSVRLLFSLPLLDHSIGAHGRLRMLVAFTLAFLAAASLDRWLRGETGARRWALAALATTVLVSWAYLGHPPPDRAAALAPLHAGSALVQGSVLALGAIFLIAATRSGPTRRRAATAWTLVALAGAELLFFFLPANPPMPRRAAFPTTPELDLLLHAQPRGRDDGGAPDWRMVALQGALLPNLNTVYGLASPGSSNPGKPALYAELLSPLLARSYGGPDRFVVPESPLYDLLGVRYVLAPLGARRPWGTTLRRRGPGAQVWERPHPLPPLFLPASARTCRGRWSRCLAAVSDFAAEARVRPGAPLPLPWTARRPESRLWLAGGAPAPAEATGGAREVGTEAAAGGPTHRGADAFLLEPRLLASSLYQDGGWRLLVNGERRSTILADGPFVAAWLPAGQHRLDLVYRPPGFLAGVLAAAFGLTLAIAWWLVPPRRWQGEAPTSRSSPSGSRSPRAAR